MALEISETDWPLLYNDHGLLIGPLRMVRSHILCLSGTEHRDVWVYCWNDPGVKERVNEQCRAVIDAHGKTRYE